MKVLFDYQIFTFQRFGGVSNSFCQMISHLPADISPVYGFEQSDNYHLREIAPWMSHVKYDHYMMRQHYFPGKKFLMRLADKMGFIEWAENVNRDYSISALKEGDFDVFHPTCYDSYFVDYLRGKPVVIIFHDMISELFPQYFRPDDIQIKAKKYLADKVDAIVAPSYTSKEDIVRILHINPQKVHVIYHGGPEIEKIDFAPIIDEKYFLFVGERSGYKNFNRLLLDFYAFHQNHRDIKLVCTGKPFSKSELALIQSLQLSDYVEHLFANGKQMKNLYGNALAFIFPSLYEGFGLPTLEAFAYGCPVLLNNTSCFPEVGGEAAMYFSQNSEKSDLVDKMEDIYSMSSSERKDVINNGYMQLSKFSWKQTGESYAKLYRLLG